MTTGCIRNELGFLDTRDVFQAPNGRRPNPVVEFALEAAETLRGALAAPLRQARQAAPIRALDPLDAATRRDIGL